MNVCNADNCCLPARVRPRLLVRPAKHWGSVITPIELRVHFCELHRSLATLESLFPKKVRRAMDLNFMHANKPLPDWSRCVLEWVDVDPSGKQGASAPINGSAQG